MFGDPTLVPTYEFGRKGKFERSYVRRGNQHFEINVELRLSGEVTSTLTIYEYPLCGEVSIVLGMNPEDLEDMATWFQVVAKHIRERQLSG